MRHRGWSNSILSRLLVCFLAAGLVLSFVLGFLDYQSRLKLAAVQAGRQMVVTAHHVRDIVRPLLGMQRPADLERGLTVFTQDPRITGLRIHTEAGETVAAGHWPQRMSTVNIWMFGGSDALSGGVDVDGMSLLVLPFVHDGRPHTLQMLIDGRVVRSGVRQEIVRQLLVAWAVLVAVTLMGIAGMRWWLVEPLGRLVRLAQRSGTAPQFAEAAAAAPHEIAEVASAIGQMLGRLEDLTSQLRHRQQACHDLYHHAPAAMISTDICGRVIECNERAEALLSEQQSGGLIGRMVIDYVRPEDRSRLRQSLQRVHTGRTCRCDLRLQCGHEVRDVEVEFVGDRGPEGELKVVRLSLLDVTEARRLIRELSEQRRLLDLVVNHMSDAILLVDARGVVVSANIRLAMLLEKSAAELIGQRYELSEFWAPLELINATAFELRMADVQERGDRRVQEQFDSRDGSYLFQLIPVCDEMQRVVAQLWVVQEVSAQVRARKQLEQQMAQVRALQRIGRALPGAENVEQVLELVMSELCEVLDTEAIGVALRGRAGRQRTFQLIWQGDRHNTISSGTAIVAAVREQLMPRILSGKATSLWTDLTQHRTWAEGFVQSGCESLAAAPLFHRDRARGILWIGRRGGNRIERRHLYLLEAIAPMLAIAAENAALRQQMRHYSLTDPVTELPARPVLPRLIAQQLAPPHRPWSLLAFVVDGDAALDDATLRTLADHLCGTMRAGDTLVRYGTRQFVAVCPDLERHEAVALAERLRATVQQAMSGDGGLTCSIGVAGSPGDHHRGQLTLDLALERAAEAAAAGGNRVVHQAGARAAAATI